MEWILVIFVHAGILSKADSMAITSVPGFTSLASCQVAGDTAKKVTAGTTKDLQFVCVKK